ncbi:MAG: CopG family transcriptional regulator, partial [Deltaproteobacteria bacterium]|nr:CopG family transcriptional regulator [Deltaproteobacteria bacterium]
MSVVRMNITIPKELADEIEKMTPSRKRSSFIAEALRQKVKDLQRERI